MKIPRRRWAIYARFLRPVEFNNNEWYDLGNRFWTKKGARKYALGFAEFAEQTWGSVYMFNYKRDESNA
jgi:hypothetical protein